MTGRLRRLFLEPAAGDAGVPASSRPVEATVVLTPPELAAVATVAVADAALQIAGARDVLVCRWAAAPVATSRAFPAVRTGRVAARLAAAGLQATADGRRTIVTLPPEPERVPAAIAAACRHADPGPLVVILAGVRPAALDELAVAADALIVVYRSGTPDDVAALTLRRLARPDQHGGLLALPAVHRSLARFARPPARRRAAALLATPAPPAGGDPTQARAAHAC